VAERLSLGERRMAMIRGPGASRLAVTAGITVSAVLVALSASPVYAGDWNQYGFDARHSQVNNAGEPITQSNVNALSFYCHAVFGQQNNFAFTGPLQAETPVVHTDASGTTRSWSAAGEDVWTSDKSCHVHAIVGPGGQGAGDPAVNSTNVGSYMWITSLQGDTVVVREAFPFIPNPFFQPDVPSTEAPFGQSGGYLYDAGGSRLDPTHGSLLKLRASNNDQPWENFFAFSLTHTPLIAHGIVVVTTARAVLGFRDSDGSMLWATKLPTHAPLSAPTLNRATNVLYVGADQIFGLSLKSGETLYTTDSRHGPFGDPLVEQGNEVVAPSTDAAGGGVDGINAFTWDLTTPQWTATNVGATPFPLSQANNVIYAATTYKHGRQGTLYGIDEATGAVLKAIKLGGASNAPTPAGGPIVADARVWVPVARYQTATQTVLNGMDIYGPG